MNSRDWIQLILSIVMFAAQSVVSAINKQEKQKPTQ